MKATLGVAMIGMALMGMAACDHKATSEAEIQGPQTSVFEQAPAAQAYRTAFVPTEDTPDFVNAAEASVNAVVHIKTTIIESDSYDEYFGDLLEHLYGIPYPSQSNAQVAYGSGVVLSPDGYIVTNNHVVEGASEVEVTFNNNMVKRAEIIGTDPQSDLALIKVEGDNYDYLVFGDSDRVRVGEWVLAVGNPFNLTSTVTAGIVSAKARNMSVLGEDSNVESFIQTDAAVNRGNSGGALVNTRGELIGINAAIASQTGTYEGYSFAIPSNIVRKVVDDLLLYGATQRAYLGLQISEMTAERAQMAGMSEIKGVFVAEASRGGAAQRAGIRSGDVLISVNGNPVNTTTQLTEIIQQFRPGDQVEVKVFRKGSEQTVQVNLLNESGSTEMVRRGESFFDSTLGVVLQPLDEQELGRLHISNGLQIVEIRRGALQGAVSEGFVITHVNDTPVSSKAELDQALNSNHGRMVTIDGRYPNGMKMSFEYYE